MTRPLENRTALITGASRGLGAALAKRFAAEGAHLILIARTVGGLEETDDAVREAGGSATLVQMDLEDNDSIDGLAAPLLERFGKIDIAIGNAAILGRLSPMGQYIPEVWEKVFKTNLLANWRLIRAIDPLLRASDAGRMIFVTDHIDGAEAPYWGPYAASKAALEKMAKTYARETVQSNLRVNLVDPGKMRTALRAQAFPGEDPQSVPAPESKTDIFVELASPACSDTGKLFTL